MSAPELLDGLAGAARALEDGDAAAAAAAMAQVGEAVRALAGAGLAPGDLRRAWELHGRCLRAAAPLEARLTGAMGQAARGQRALAAYGG